MREHLDSGVLQIQWQPALKYALDQLAERLLNLLEYIDIGNVRELLITDRGIELAADGSTAQAILGGLLRSGRETWRPRET